MVQIARPVSDQAAGAWTPTPSSPTTLFDKIDEAVASDADYISSEAAPATSAARVNLGAVTDPLTGTGHIVRRRLRKDQAGGAQINAVTRLIEGASTVVASFTNNNVTETWTTFADSLSVPEADSITNYGDLDLEFEGDQV
ncbi:MAG: hypothetical protein V3V01_10770 [Acidimicrobiales bacterium]